MTSDPRTKFMHHPGPAPYHLSDDPEAEALHQRLIASAQLLHGPQEPRVPNNPNSRSWHKD